MISATIFTMICIMLAALVLAVFAVAYKKCVRQAKQFEFFLCHHKASAAAHARLFKMLLTEHEMINNDVFVDSDNLTHLDVLFDTLARDVQTLCILGSKDVLRRPWCVGEVVTAHINEMEVCVIRFPGFRSPDDAFISGFRDQVPDIDCLVRSGITEEMVQKALRWFNDLELQFQLPLKLTSG